MRYIGTFLVVYEIALWINLARSSFSRFMDGCMDVHHVPGFVVAHADVALQFLLQAETVEGVAGGKVRCGQVVITRSPRGLSGAG